MPPPARRKDTGVTPRPSRIRRSTRWRHVPPRFHRDLTLEAFARASTFSRRLPGSRTSPRSPRRGIRPAVSSWSARTTLQAARGRFARCCAWDDRRSRIVRALRDDRAALKTEDDWRNDETMAGGDALRHSLAPFNSLGPRIARSMAIDRLPALAAPTSAPKHDGGVPIRQRRVALLLARDPVAAEGAAPFGCSAAGASSPSSPTGFIAARGGFPRVILQALRIRGYRAMPGLPRGDRWRATPDEPRTGDGRSTADGSVYAPL